MPPEPPASTRRLAAGVVVRCDGETLRVRSPYPWPTWKARQLGRHGQADHPGTGVFYDGSWFEVRSGEETNGAWSYRLEAWDAAFALRGTSELNEESCLAVRQKARDLAERERRRRQLWWFIPILGLLPKEKQESLANDVGFPPTTATSISAVIILGYSMLSLVIGWAYMRGLPTVAGSTWALWCFRLIPLWVLLMGESLLRFYLAMSGVPMGSLLVAPLWNLAHARLEHPDRPSDADADIDLERERDEVRPLDEPGVDLEIVSRLSKPHWALGSTGILVGETSYSLEETFEEAGEDGRPRFVFRLKEADPGTTFRSWASHQPEEVRELWRERKRAEAATFVESWAHLWGLLDEPTQLALRRGYQYDPWPRTRSAIVVEGILGGLHLVLGYGYMTEEGSGAAAVVFLFGAFLLWEALLRWARYRVGTIHPSVFGVPLAPLVRNALRWLPPEETEEVGEGMGGAVEDAGSPPVGS